ncbi:hypothetical protein L9F63_022362 [Diploptera punctata]|uniref:Ionotropic glutamate receptor C-terminal domain-containing protein n=1 Tax=Diploptera punctata TaxID=6984 RepID=A0AAD7ZMB3_DIPPU|nr:hypothetical protein L9F63_022362 [Diploptera punctata]
MVYKTNDHEAPKCVVEILKLNVPIGGTIFISIATEKSSVRSEIRRTKRSPSVKTHNCSEEKIIEEDHLQYLDMDVVYEYQKYYVGNLNLDWECKWCLRVNASYDVIQNGIIEQIHKENSWTLTVDVMETYSKYNFYKFDGFIFILLAKQLNYHMRNLKHIIRNLSLPKATVIIIVLGIPQNIQVVFDFLSTFSLFKTIVIHQDKNEFFSISSWRPDHCGNFERVILLGTCQEVRTIPIRLKIAESQRDYKKCPVVIYGHNDPPFAIYNNYDVITDGIEFILIQQIISHLNLQLKDYKTDEFDKTETIGLGGSRIGTDELMNSITFMERYHTEFFTWFVPESKSRPHWSNLTQVFNIYTWGFILLSLALISISLKLLNSLKITDHMQYFLDPWAILLNVSASKIPHGISVRVVFMTWVISSIALTTVFQAFMTSYFTDPGIQHQIDTFEELEESNLNLSFHILPKEYWYILPIRDKYIQFTNMCDMLIYCFYVSNIGAFTDENIFIYNSRLYFKDIRTTSFHKFSSEGISVHRTLNMFTLSPYLPLVNKLTKRLVEAGIVEKIVDDFVDPSGWTRGVKLEANAKNDYIPLSLLHMTSVFTYLLIGLALSNVIFVGEVILNYFHFYTT